MRIFRISAMITAIVICGSIVGCRKSLIKHIPSFRAQTTWYWGGDPGRRGLSMEEIDPPLKLAWTHKASGAVGEAIAVADTFLFIGTQNGDVTILHLRTGKSEKTLTIEKRVKVTCLVHSNRIVVAQRWKSPSLRALDISTGEDFWRIDAGPIVGEPLLFKNHIVVGNERGEVFNFDVRNGEKIWEIPLKKPIRGSIAKSGDNLTCASDGGVVWSLSFTSGLVLWNQKLAGSISATPVLTEDKLFIGTTAGLFYCLSLADGSIQWQYKVRGSIYQTAAVSRGFVYFGTTQGIIYCLDNRDGVEKWYFDTDSVIGTSPLLSGRWIYFGTLDRTLYALERATGIERWQFRTRGRIRTTPLIWKGMLILASEERYVYGFTEET